MKKLALAVFGSALILSSVAAAQSRNVQSSPYVSNQAFTAPDNYRVNYFANLMQGATVGTLTATSSLKDNGNDSNQTPVGGATSPDDPVDIVNPGTNGASGVLGSAVGDLCALIYVVDTREELEECCGCLVTPDQLIELSTQKDLLANPAHPFIIHSGTIKIISSTPTGPGGTGATIAEYNNAVCDPSNPNPVETLRRRIGAFSVSHICHPTRSNRHVVPTSTSR